MTHSTVFNTVVTSLLACPEDNLFVSRYSKTGEPEWVAKAIGDISNKIAKAFLNHKKTDPNIQTTALACLQGILASPHNNITRSVKVVLSKHKEEDYKKDGKLLIPDSIQQEIFTHLVSVAFVTAEGTFKGTKGV